VKQFSHSSRIASVSLPRFSALVLALSLGTTSIFGIAATVHVARTDAWTRTENFAYARAKNNRTVVGVNFPVATKCSGVLILAEKLESGTSVSSNDIDVVIQVDGGTPYEAHMVALVGDVGMYQFVSEPLSWEFVKDLGTGGSVRIQSKNNPEVVITATLKGSSITMRDAYSFCKEAEQKTDADSSILYM
jgi:hypothetical protein